jgi:putative DNA primase/helicase
VNISSEMSADGTIADGYLKAIASGDLVEAERKYKPSFSFKPFVKLIAATNHLPRLLDLSEGFFRRAVVLTFNRQFSEAEQDRSLESTLRGEMNGILRWAVVGLRRLRDRGRFIEPTSSISALAEYRKDSDPAGQFADECLLPSTAEGLRASAIYQGYKEWCTTYGYRAMNNSTFGKRLKELGFTSYRTSAGSVWRVRERPGNEFVNRFLQEERIADAVGSSVAVCQVRGAGDVAS